MYRHIRKRYETRARIARTLGHASRLFILEALSRQDRCVYELAELIGADISTVSRHLSLLKAAGLVDFEKSGPQACYRLATEEVLNLLHCLKKCCGQIDCGR